MALSYLFDPNKQFQDKNGLNNVCGHLEVFIDNSDDHAPTYCNFTGTLNPERIVIDNNGRAVVIVDELKTYRIEVYDISGNMLWSQYPVRPTNVIYGDYNVYNADIYGTPDEIDVDVETYASGVKKFTIKLANSVKTVLGNIQSSISSIVQSLATKKDKQTAVSVTGGTLKGVASMSQNANGEVTLTLNDIQDGTTTQKGVVQLNNAINSTSTTEAATPKAVKDAYDELNNKIVARAVFLSQAEWAVQSQIPGDPAKVYYVENSTGEDAYTVYVWKESTSEYVEVDESSIDLDGYWHDGPATSGNGNVVTDVSLGNDGVPQVVKGITALTQHQSVTDNSPTLAWDTTSTVGTVGGTSLRVTMPSNPASGKADNTPTFTEASTRENLVGHGETMPTILGKVKKCFTDLKSVAWSGSYADLSNKPTIPTVDQNFNTPSSTNAISTAAVYNHFDSFIVRGFGNVAVVSKPLTEVWDEDHRGLFKLQYAVTDYFGEYFIEIQCKGTITSRNPLGDNGFARVYSNFSINLGCDIVQYAIVGDYVVFGFFVSKTNRYMCLEVCGHSVTAAAIKNKNEYNFTRIDVDDAFWSVKSKAEENPVGSTSTPVYVDSNGQVQPCNPSSMSVGSATTATNYASGGGIDSALGNKADKASSGNGMLAVIYSNGNYGSSGITAYNQSQINGVFSGKVIPSLQKRSQIDEQIYEFICNGSTVGKAVKFTDEYAGEDRLTFGLEFASDGTVLQFYLPINNFEENEWIWDGQTPGGSPVGIVELYAGCIKNTNGTIVSSSVHSEHAIDAYNGSAVISVKHFGGINVGSTTRANDSNSKVNIVMKITNTITGKYVVVTFDLGVTSFANGSANQAYAIGVARCNSYGFSS